MTRKANFKEMGYLKGAIEEHPGERPGFFARLLGWRREKANRALTSFQEKGFLFRS